MKVAELSTRMGWKAVAGARGLEREVRGGYCGDLLSDVMAKAPPGCLWLTVQGHLNIIAVALLREMAAVVITSGREPDPDTARKAEEEGIPLFTSPESAFTLAGRLWELGIGRTDPA